MRARRLGKIGSWLGLFAILLVFCAPIVSQTLAAQQRDAFRFAELDLCSVAQATHDDHRAPMPAAGHGDACAYCSFAHVFPALTPGKPGAAAASAWTVVVFRPAESAPRRMPASPRVRSRSPPSIA